MYVDAPTTIFHFSSSDAADAFAACADFLATLQEHAESGIDEHALEIVFNELVANVVRHAPGAIQVTLAVDNLTSTLEVSDTGTGFIYVPVLPPSLYSENGRGLYLVSRYATDVWVENFDGGGASVFATVPLKANRHVLADPAR